MCGDNFSRWPLCVADGRGPWVGCDIDGVLRDLDQKCKEVIKRDFPKAKEKETHLGSWDIHDRYENIPVGIEDYLFYDKAEEVFTEAVPYDGAVEFIEKLHEMVHKHNGKAFYVTQQNHRGANATLRWLADNKFPIEGLVVVPFRDNKPYGQPGGKLSARCDIIIDDNTNHLRQHTKERGQGAIGRAQAWNSDWAGTRLNNFNDILERVDFYLNKIDEKKTKHRTGRTK